MSLKMKNKFKRKVTNIAFKIIKPFIPFIIIIIGIILAICTVVDTLFTTEEDILIAQQLSNDNYEEQYAEWLSQKEDSPTTIITGTGLISKRNVYLANTWFYNNYFPFWNESTSYFTVYINYILVQMLAHLLVQTLLLWLMV